MYLLACIKLTRCAFKPWQVHVTKHLHACSQLPSSNAYVRYVIYGARSATEVCPSDSPTDPELKAKGQEHGQHDACICWTYA